MPRSDIAERPLPTDAQTLGFTPAVSTQWQSPTPRNTQQALDGIALIGNEVIPTGILDAITISDDGGLNISWTAGAVYTPAQAFVDTAAGSDTCTDDVPNFLYWKAATETVVLASDAHGHDDDVPIGVISVQHGDIWDIQTEPAINERVHAIQHGLASVFPQTVETGLNVTEDTDVTVPHDVQNSAGTYFNDLHKEVEVPAQFSRTLLKLIRWYDSDGAGAWIDDQGSTQIDITDYNDIGVGGLTAYGVNKWGHGLFLVSATAIHWIYPSAQHNTVAEAIAAGPPARPPGLIGFPSVTSYVLQAGEAAFAASTSDQWIDQRVIAGPSGTGGGGGGGDVTTAANSGLAGGGTPPISLTVDGSNLGFTPGVDPAADTVVLYDDSLSATLKDTVDNIVNASAHANLATDPHGANLTLTGTLDVAGVTTITGIADGGLTNYDLKVGDTTTPDYGMIQIGNSVIGRTSYSVGAIDLDGAIMMRNIGGPVTSEIEFIWTESAGNTCRFALPKSAVGNATYNSRSMLLAGPAPADTDFVKVTYWQGTGIFDNLACDTSGAGADLGVQNDLEVENTLYVDDIQESTVGAGVTIKTDGVTSMVLSGDATPGAASDNQLLIGNAVPTDAAQNEVIVTGQAKFTTLAVYTASSNANHNSGFSMRRTRGTLAVPVKCNSGDRVGALSFASYDDGANSFKTRAGMRAEIDGAVTGATIPMRMLFLTGTTSQVESFRVMSDQNIRVRTTNELQFRDANTSIKSPSSSDLRLHASADVFIDSGTSLQVRTGAGVVVLNLLTGSRYMELLGPGVDQRINWVISNYASLDSSTTQRFRWGSTGISWFNAAEAAQQTVTGVLAAASPVAQSILAALVAHNLVIDGTT